MSLTKVTYSMVNGASANVLDFGAVGDGVADDTAAIQATIDSGADVIYFPPNSTFLIGTLTVRSNTPKTLIGYGAKITLSDTTNFGINLFGLYHKVFGLSIEGVGGQTHRGIKITTDATTTQSSFLTLRDIRMYNVYQGVLADMEATATGRACYRHTFDNCIIENYYQQATWSGSFAVQFGGVSYGDAAGNDSKIIGGLFKGYERNILIVGGAGTKIIGASIDGGGNAFHLSSTQYIEIVSCYCEYNTTVISWDANLGIAPYRTFFVGGTMAGFTNRTIGTALDNALWGSDETGYVFGYPLFGSYLYDTGVVQLTGTNGIDLKAPKTYFGASGLADNTILTTYAGSPEGLVTAGLGSLCSDTTNGKLYVKQTGTGNTGWVQK